MALDDKKYVGRTIVLTDDWPVECILSVGPYDADKVQKTVDLFQAYLDMKLEEDYKPSGSS